MSSLRTKVMQALDSFEEEVQTRVTDCPKGVCVAPVNRLAPDDETYPWPADGELDGPQSHDWDRAMYWSSVVECAMHDAGLQCYVVPVEDEDESLSVMVTGERRRDEYGNLD